MKTLALIMILFIALLFSCRQQSKVTEISPSKIAVDSLSGNTKAYATTTTAKNIWRDFRIKPSAQLTKFIPEGYGVLDTAIGDLNLDSITDMIMVLELSKTVYDDTDPPRPLLLLTGKADGSYELAARNDKVVYCIFCGGIHGDPYEQITIKKGNFSIEHFGGSSWKWTKVITFKYRPSEKSWYLFRDGGEWYHQMMGENGEFTKEEHEDILENQPGYGKVLFQDYDIYLDTASKK